LPTLVLDQYNGLAIVRFGVVGNSQGA